MAGSTQVHSSGVYARISERASLGEQAVVGEREPLLSYATGEISRLTADLYEYVQKIHHFVDEIEGTRPTPMQGNAANKHAEQPPLHRGEALREVIRQLQEVRNDASDAGSRLSAI